MKSSGLYDDIDLVVPVPLHYRKQLRRGYNQSTYLAEGIARELGVAVDGRALRRSRNNPSQVRRMHSERWEGVGGLFEVRHKERLAGRSILLVDDVFTTGATMTACIEAIRRAAPDCRISAAVLAVSRKGLGIDE